jgi:thioesterase domain-containing protein
VKLMMLLDTERPTKKRILLTDWFWVRQRVDHIFDVVSELVRADRQTRKELIGSLLRRKLGIGPSQQAQETDRFYQAKVRYRRLLYSHLPRKYPGHVAVIVNQEQASSDPDLGWTGFAERLDVHVVAGDHHSILTDHGKEVARVILKSMEDAKAQAVAAKVPV